MRPVEEIRRERLAALVAESGGQAALARVIGKDKNQVSQWLGKAGSRNLSAASAREIERICGKPAGWMDSPPTLAPSQPARLDEATLADALAVINGAAELRGVSPVLSPRAIAIAYALLEDAAERVSPLNMVRLIKAFMAKEEGSDVPSA